MISYAFDMTRGYASPIVPAFLHDATLTGVTALAFDTANLIITVRRELASSVTVYTGANIQDITTLGTYAAPSASKCRFKKVDDTNAPGCYELQFLASVFDASDASRYVVITVYLSGTIKTCVIQVNLKYFTEDDLSANTKKIFLTGLDISGAAGNAAAVIIKGSGTGNGISVEPGDTSGYAVTLSGGDGIGGGLHLDGGRSSDGDGLFINGSGNGPGIVCSGGTSGSGAIVIQGNDESSGIYVRGGNSAGAAAAGHAIDARGGDSQGTAHPAGHGSQFVGGSASTTSGGIAGIGIKVLGGDGAATTNGAGTAITIAGGGTYTVSGGLGIQINATGTKEALLAVGGLSGGNSVAIGGVNAALDILATSSHGIRIISGGSSKHGFTITAAGTSGNALDLVASGGGHPISDDAIERTTFAANSGLQTIRSATAKSGSTATTIKLDASASATDNFYTGNAVYLTSGTGALQPPGAIIGYVGSTKVATVSQSWITTPDNTTTFAIRPAVYGMNTIMLIGP